jgi:hypothetical protein
MNAATLIPALRTKAGFSLDFSHDTQLGIFNENLIDRYSWELQEGIKRTKFALVSKLLDNTDHADPRNG